MLLFSDKNKFEIYTPSSQTMTNNNKNNKDKDNLLSSRKNIKKINKRTSSPPIIQHKNNNNNNTPSSPQFYYYNHSDLTCMPMTPPPSATFQSSIKSTNKRKRPYKQQSHHQQQRRYSCPSFDMMDINKNKDLNGLEDEFAYTQETLTTVNIMFDSLKQAFIDCEPHLKPNATRLDDMEKELLSAYDDLELQVIHLERHINKLESSWQQWKSTCHHLHPQQQEQIQLLSPSTSTSSLS